MGAIASIALWIGLSLMGYTIAEANESNARGIIVEAQNLGKDILSRIAKNESLLSSITQAYNDKDSKLATSILQGAGFGGRHQALRKAQESSKDKYLNDTKRIAAANAQANADYNSMSSAVARAGNTKAGNKTANAALTQIKQNINAGLYDATPSDVSNEGGK